MRRILIQLAVLICLSAAKSLTVQWVDPGISLIRDHIWIAGGRPGSTPKQDSIYNISLRAAFSNPLDFDSLLQSIPIKTGNSDTQSSSVTKGALFANDGGFFTFGGLKTSATDPEDGMVYHTIYNAKNKSSRTSPAPLRGVFDSLLENRCCGAYVSISSENLGFYFGGMASPERGLLNVKPLKKSGIASVPLNDLIRCNTSDTQNPTCEIIAVPEWVPARAEAEIVWIPRGHKGLLLIVGGVVAPADIAWDTVSTDARRKNRFMDDLVLYDIASNTWHLQSTLGGTETPSQRAAFCSVLASPEDGASFHIFMYGGYDGNYEDFTVSFDDMWVLSLPAFQWTKISGGIAEHRRQSHKCVLPYPNLMFSIGGSVEFGQDLFAGSRVLEVFDLHTLTWNNTYDPAVYAERFQVPAKIITQLGAGSKGLSRIPEDLNASLVPLFRTTYPGRVVAYWPYIDNSFKANLKRLGITRWLGLTVALAGYLVLSSIAIIMIVVIRRHMFFKRSGTQIINLKSNSKLIRWMHNAPQDRKKGNDQKKMTNEDFQPLKLAYIDEPEETRSVMASTVRTRSMADSVSGFGQSLLDGVGGIEMHRMNTTTTISSISLSQEAHTAYSPVSCDH